MDAELIQCGGKGKRPYFAINIRVSSPDGLKTQMITLKLSSRQYGLAGWILNNGDYDRDFEHEDHDIYRRFFQKIVNSMKGE